MAIPYAPNPDCSRLIEVDVRLPGKGYSNSHGARPVHLIITMIKWIRTRRLSINNSLSLQPAGGGAAVNSLRLLNSKKKVNSKPYRGTSLVKKLPPPRTLQ